jgi:hypothetical protein
MEKLNSNIFTVDQKQKYHGLEVGTRMTVVKIKKRKLMLISPISIDAKLAIELSTQGDVAYIIAPNLYHHLYLRKCCEHYPNAKVYVAKGLAENYKDINCITLSSTPPKGWRKYLDQTEFEGYAVQELSGHVELNEVVFFHRETNTLILTDAAYHIAASSPLLSKLLAKAVGLYGVLGSTALEKFALKRRYDAQKALLKILEWPFDSVVIAHGEIIKSDGRKKLIDGYQWLLTNPQFNKQVRSKSTSLNRKEISIFRCG